MTVTWAPHQYTHVGWENFQNWIHSGLDNVLFTPNGRVHRILTKIAFLGLCHPFQPFIIGQRHIGPLYSCLYDVPLVFYGENQAEYGNAIEENQSPVMDQSFFVKDRDLGSINIGGMSVQEIMSEYQLDEREFNPYLPVEPERIKQVQVEVHYLGYYLNWDPQECYYYASNNTGFKANDERTQGSYSKYSSIDDKIDPLHYWTTLIKFGIGRATYDSCQEIRSAKITREEGVILVKKFDREFPKRYFSEMLEYMDITEEKFWEVCDSFRPSHLWEKNR